MHVEGWCGQGGSETYRHNRMRAIRSAMRWAARQGYIVASPLQGMDMPTPEPRDLYLTVEQWEKVLAVVVKARDGGCLHDAFIMMRESGCRVQELRKFEATHLDREHRCMVLERVDAKGKKRRRVVHLTDKAFEIVERLAKKHPEGKLFRSSKGTPWTRHTLDSRCWFLTKKLGFKVRPGAIRHTFATYAAVAKVDIKAVADLMGHKDLKMLMEVYSHADQMDDHMKAALKKATS
jgi:integrase/recombinase XerC/integrase/recombinase XerD